MSHLVHVTESEAVTKVVNAHPEKKTQKGKTQSTILKIQNPYLVKRVKNVLKLS